jgi:hypothetical protein
VDGKSFNHFRQYMVFLWVWYDFRACSEMGSSL